MKTFCNLLLGKFKNEVNCLTSSEKKKNLLLPSKETVERLADIENGANIFGVAPHTKKIGNCWYMLSINTNLCFPVTGFKNLERI